MNEGNDDISGKVGKTIKNGLAFASAKGLVVDEFQMAAAIIVQRICGFCYFCLCRGGKVHPGGRWKLKNDLCGGIGAETHRFYDLVPGIYDGFYGIYIVYEGVTLRNSDFKQAGSGGCEVVKFPEHLFIT